MESVLGGFTVLGKRMLSRIFESYVSVSRVLVVLVVVYVVVMQSDGPSLGGVCGEEECMYCW